MLNVVASKVTRSFVLLLCHMVRGKPVTEGGKSPTESLWISVKVLTSISGRFTELETGGSIGLVCFCPVSDADPRRCSSSQSIADSGVSAAKYPGSNKAKAKNLAFIQNHWLLR